MDAVSRREDAQQDIHRDSHGTQDSQTASDFINQQLALEADAREVLPYKFDKCTHVLGPLRQNVFACLTCSPPPASAAQVYTPAGVCYACSISCHGEHTLVELFSRRNFVCDCGTTRLPETSPCMLRADPKTGARGVHSQEAHPGNHYNHNFQNRFCACGEEYDAENEKGTMFQCLGLGTVETGGCGEDWYHPECLMGLRRDWYKNVDSNKEQEQQQQQDGEEEDSHPIPPGFPHEDGFDAMICYKCVESNPWIKRYAGTPGFLPPVFRKESNSEPEPKPKPEESALSTTIPVSLKRKASESDMDTVTGPTNPSKRVKDEPEHELTPQSNSTEPAPGPATSITTTSSSNHDQKAESNPERKPEPTVPVHKHDSLPPTPPPGPFSLFLKSDFREHLCHCPTCYPNLIPHPQLVEEEETYEPSLSSASESDAVAGAATGGSARSASLLDRGEAALSTMDRVKAIEGVMVYNHLRDKVKEFLKPYAETGRAVSAEDIKAYFEKLRGDESGIREASAKPGDGDGDGGGPGGDNRRDQPGY
ncbi:Protein mlo2 [Exophiala dermatitidis]